VSAKGAVVLGGADGKAISSSWQLNARSPVEEKGENCLLYIFTHIKSNKSACEYRYTNNNMKHTANIPYTNTHKESHQLTLENDLMRCVHDLGKNK